MISTARCMQSLQPNVLTMVHTCSRSSCAAPFALMSPAWTVVPPAHHSRIPQSSAAAATACAACAACASLPLLQHGRQGAEPPAGFLQPACQKHATSNRQVRTQRLLPSAHPPLPAPALRLLRMHAPQHSPYSHRMRRHARPCQPHNFQQRPKCRKPHRLLRCQAPAQQQRHEPAEMRSQLQAQAREERRGSGQPGGRPLGVVPAQLAFVQQDCRRGGRGARGAVSSEGRRSGRRSVAACRALVPQTSLAQNAQRVSQPAPLQALFSICFADSLVIISW